MPSTAIRAVAFGSTLLAPLVAQAAGGEATGGPMDPVLPTAIWALGIFLIVLALLWKLAWGPLIKALDERESKIKASLEAADVMRAEQERFQAEQEKLLAEARKEANEIVAEGKRDAEAVKEKIVSDARDAAEDAKSKALSDIDRAKDNAVIEIHQRAVDLSVQIAEKLVGHAVSVEDQERLVQQTIDEYKTKN